MSITFSPAELINIAIGIERRGISFYDIMAKSTENEMAREVFEKLVEMERIREYAWCCGAGGGVLEADPDFAAWTSQERIREAQATGADAIVTTCPWCVSVFKEAVDELGADLAVYELTELALESAKAPQTGLKIGGNGNDR